MISFTTRCPVVQLTYLKSFTTLPPSILTLSPTTSLKKNTHTLDMPQFHKVRRAPFSTARLPPPETIPSSPQFSSSSHPPHIRGHNSHQISASAHLPRNGSTASQPVGGTGPPLRRAGHQSGPVQWHSPPLPSVR